MSEDSAWAGATVLVTGASGFLGSHCLRRLLDERCEIHAVSRGGADHAEDARVHWHAVDLHDAAAASALVARVKPSHLLHGAWVATPGFYARSPENLAWLDAGVALLRAFGEHGGARFVGIGSSAEYARTQTPAKEDDTLIRPDSIYGACKAALWLAAGAAAQHYGFSAAWGRVFLLYGPGDAPERLIPSMLSTLGRHQVMRTTDGRQVRDFIYAADAADGLVRLLTSRVSGAVNIGTGRATPVRSVIDYIADRLKAADRVRLGAIETAAAEPGFLVADTSKGATELGWSASTTIETGLDAMIAAARDGTASTLEMPPTET